MIEFLIEGVDCLLRGIAIIGMVALPLVGYFYYLGNKAEKEKKQKSQAVLNKSGRGDIRVK